MSPFDHLATQNLLTCAGPPPPTLLRASLILIRRRSCPRFRFRSASRPWRCRRISVACPSNSLISYAEAGREACPSRPVAVPEFSVTSRAPLCRHQCCPAICCYFLQQRLLLQITSAPPLLSREAPDSTLASMRAFAAESLTPLWLQHLRRC